MHEVSLVPREILANLFYKGITKVLLSDNRVALSAVILRTPEGLNADAQYDFIIAGGGTGGAVVAARLAENPNVKVLVIEAGPSNEDIFETRPPGLDNELPRTRVDWNFTLTPQTGLNNRSTAYTRGRMLGGCSSHNGMVCTRCSQDDWNLWANITGDESLAWDNILPFMFKAEVLTSDSENQPEQGHIDPTIHGRNGRVSTSAAYSVHPFNDMLIETTKELTKEFPFKLDMNDGSPIGIAWNQFTIDHNAERSSSATAYLAKAGNNVDILVNTYVTRVLPVGDGTDFRTVEFAADAQSPKRQLTAKKEVVVAGGIIGTPQILLSSGIGKREELEAIGIPTLLDNPSVGKNLTDQVSALMLMNTTIQNTDFDRDTALAQWNETPTGPLVLPNHLNHIIYVRLPDDAAPFIQEGFADPTAGKNSPHIEFVFSQISAHSPATVVDVPPTPSGGSVTLKTTDAFAHPVIDFGLLSEDVDTAILREAIRTARKMYSAPVFKNSVFESLLPAANVTNDEDLDAYLRTVASPFLHGIGSAAMSPRGASWGVVDPDFRVKGAYGLRIVDASIFPTVPSGHTQVPVYGIAELASVLIAKAWE
ncbi:Choline dehydrogenase, mitochondrial [Leucoagaricus sp. SymC.cos]|nr:Choline dehydrogenase, mitochondrial [Leucoagaricus sp. SymC.cos]